MFSRAKDSEVLQIVSIIPAAHTNYWSLSEQSASWWTYDAASYTGVSTAKRKRIDWGGKVHWFPPVSYSWLDPTLAFFSTMQSSSKASYKPYSRCGMILHRSGTPGRGTAVPWAYTGKHVTQRAATPPHCLLGAQGRPFHCLSISAYSGTLEPTAFPLRWSDCYFEFCSL